MVGAVKDRDGDVRSRLRSASTKSVWNRGNDSIRRTNNGNHTFPTVCAAARIMRLYSAGPSPSRGGRWAYTTSACRLSRFPQAGKQRVCMGSKVIPRADRKQSSR